MNKKKSNQLIIYIVSVVVLFAIPIFTIASNTNTLKDGTEFLFKVEAYDPYDMFRGNYLNINFEEDTAFYIPDYNNSKEENYRKEECYVTIGTREDGFAYFKTAGSKKPNNTSDYFKTTGYYSEYDNKFSVDTPNRYYMNEDKSENAEKIYRENLDNAYVKVRVKDGKMVLVGVYINDILIDSID